MKGFIKNKFQGSEDFMFYEIDLKQSLRIPLFATRISAGFPSPADDYLDKKLDLNELLIRHPAATFFIRVKGNSMEEANIFDGDILIVDRSLTPKNNDVVVCVINGEFAVKRYIKRGKEVWLYSEHPDYEPIRITEEMDFQIWGVVPYVIHKN